MESEASIPTVKLPLDLEHKPSTIFHWTIDALWEMFRQKFTMGGSDFFPEGQEENLISYSRSKISAKFSSFTLTAPWLLPQVRRNRKHPEVWCRSLLMSGARLLNVQTQLNGLDGSLRLCHLGVLYCQQ